MGGWFLALQQCRLRSVNIPLRWSMCPVMELRISRQQATQRLPQVGRTRATNTLPMHEYQGYLALYPPCMHAGDYHSAVQAYTAALEHASESAEAWAALLGNRSAAYERQQLYNEALQDADACAALRPGWDRVNLLASDRYTAHVCVER